MFRAMSRACHDVVSLPDDVEPLEPFVDDELDVDVDESPPPSLEDELFDSLFDSLFEPLAVSLFDSPLFTFDVDALPLEPPSPDSLPLFRT